MEADKGDEYDDLIGAAPAAAEVAEEAEDAAFWGHSTGWPEAEEGRAGLLEQEKCDLLATKYPGDIHCILRVPDDIADRLRENLDSREASHKETSLMELTPLGHSERESIEGGKGAEGGDDAVEGGTTSAENARLWKVKILGQEYHGTLFDLPCRLESHMLPSPSGSHAVAYKAADIAQMLLVHREPHVSIPALANRMAEVSGERSTSSQYTWPHGLTPGTKFIRETLSEPPPNPKGFLNPRRMAEAEQLLVDRMDNKDILFTEFISMTEEQKNGIPPESVWQPDAVPPELSKALFNYCCKAASSDDEGGKEDLDAEDSSDAMEEGEDEDQDEDEKNDDEGVDLEALAAADDNEEDDEDFDERQDPEPGSDSESGDLEDYPQHRYFHVDGAEPISDIEDEPFDESGESEPEAEEDEREEEEDEEDEEEVEEEKAARWAGRLRGIAPTGGGKFHTNGGDSNGSRRSGSRSRSRSGRRHGRRGKRHSST